MSEVERFVSNAWVNRDGDMVTVEQDLAPGLGRSVLEVCVLIDRNYSDGRPGYNCVVHWFVNRDCIKKKWFVRLKEVIDSTVNWLIGQGYLQEKYRSEVADVIFQRADQRGYCLVTVEKKSHD